MPAFVSLGDTVTGPCWTGLQLRPTSLRTIWVFTVIHEGRLHSCPPDHPHMAIITTPGRQKGHHHYHRPWDLVWHGAGAPVGTPTPRPRHGHPDEHACFFAHPPPLTAHDHLRIQRWLHSPPQERP